MEYTEKRANQDSFINVRDISDFFYCKRKVFLRRVRRIKEKPNKEMMKGMLKHKIYDELNRKEEYLVKAITEPLNCRDIESLYYNTLFVIANKIFSKYHNLISRYEISKEIFWREFISLAGEEVSLRANALRKLIEQGFLATELWQRLEPKYYTEYQLVDFNLMLKGRVDRLLLHKSRAIPIELKNGKVKGEPYISDKIQLAAYALLIENVLGKKVVSGKIKYSNSTFTILITAEMKQEVLDILNRIREMEKTREEPPILSNFRKCERCGLRNICFRNSFKL